ncbi:hypothetical protein PRIPAC_95343 [Pristionchus pacificus]|uniref:Large ribosomal subunit protein uL29 n=1 Tax=Pristionchus pacificus TaxID=54126 RepID=A0A2A6B3D4_PRIPA|nr:hypothetical protein PRIPAC_95343 [Pristionchus pacificus]|eukprot:PDM60384.1 ribosomal protein [Pristionchus pacificus]
MRPPMLLACLLAVAAACIPTKHPEPGIPAVTPACATIPLADAVTCGSVPFGCDTANPPVVSTVAISCNNGKRILIIKVATVTGGAASKLSKIRVVRKNIARVLTVINRTNISYKKL